MAVGCELSEAPLVQGQVLVVIQLTAVINLCMMAACVFMGVICRACGSKSPFVRMQQGCRSQWSPFWPAGTMVSSSHLDSPCTSGGVQTDSAERAVLCWSVLNIFRVIWLTLNPTHIYVVGATSEQLNLSKPLMVHVLWLGFGSAVHIKTDVLTR